LKKIEKESSKEKTYLNREDMIMSIYRYQKPRNNNITAFKPESSNPTNCRVIQKLHSLAATSKPYPQACYTSFKDKDLKLRSNEIGARFDRNFSQQEQLPQRLQVEISEIIQHGAIKVRMVVNGKQIGNDLTDNSYDQDGYRFHDVFHLAYAAILGWSPVIRQFLNCKRKSNPIIDEIEDGGRAKATEEGISLLVFSHAKKRNFWAGMSHINGDVLNTIKMMTGDFEVSQCSVHDWEKAILDGYAVWRKIYQNGGGIITIDRTNRSIVYHARSANLGSHANRKSIWIQDAA
jgi:MazG C-terminal domain